ncbi:Hypothetical predicted protein [Octopus vulgaris]|uniref:Uncharacterized protein n=1 Tax=Octopus vulgaris TaxID=6645 RepID=A0AA36FDI7_OCTVU|nr:Hypothetical predicted protein [Octopus vulgaris]
MSCEDFRAAVYDIALHLRKEDMSYHSRCLLSHCADLKDSSFTNKYRMVHFAFTFQIVLISVVIHELENAYNSAGRCYHLVPKSKSLIRKTVR